MSFEIILDELAKPGLDPTDETTRELAYRINSWHQSELDKAKREAMEEMARELLNLIGNCRGQGGSDYALDSIIYRLTRLNEEGKGE